MDKVQILILCAGEQGRFVAPYKKQLAVVNGKTLLQRMIEQCNVTPTVVTIHDDIKEVAFENDADVFRPIKHNKTVRTLLATKKLWKRGNQVIVLLGDVYYSEKAVKTILRYRGALAVFGNRIEIFAVSFVKHPEIIKALKSACSTKRGKLWEFYRFYCGIPHKKHRFDTQNIYRDIRDESDDIDTVEQLEKLRKEVALRVKS